MRFFTLFLATFLLFAISNVQASWYLSPSGSDSALGSSTGAAWKTLEHACAALQSLSDSTALNLAAGVYTLTVPCILNRDVIGASGVTIQMTVNGTLYYDTIPSAHQVANLLIIASGMRYPAVVSNSAVTTVKNVAFQVNNAYAINGYGTSLAVTGCNFTGTTTSPQLIALGGSTTGTISSSRFTNAFGDNLSGVSATDSMVTISSSVFDNMSGSVGVGLYALRSSATVNSCQFSNLVASNGSVGAGVYFLDKAATQTLDVDSSTFTNCSALAGGGLFASGQTVQVTNSHFYNNFGVNEGGGIYVQSSNDVYVSDCDFEGNQAAKYAGLSIYTSNAEVDSCTFTNNYADTTGGGAGIYGITYSPNSQTAQVTDCTFSGNTVGSEAGSLVSTGLEIRGDIDSTISGGHFDDDNWDAGLPALHLLAGRTHVSISPSTSKMPYIAGMIISSHNMTLNSDLVINGSVMFIVIKKEMAGDRTSLDWISLNGHTLTLLPFDSSYIHFQSVVFVGGKVSLPNGSSVFCCNVDGTGVPGLLGIDFVDAPLFLSGTATLEFKSTLNSVRFLGSATNRYLNATEQSVLYTMNAEQMTLEINDVYVEQLAHMEAANMLVTGNVHIASRLILYPTWWNGVNAPLTIDGNLQLNGALQLADDLQLPPFPLVSFQDAPSLVLYVAGTMTQTFSVYSPWSIYYNATVSSHTVFAHATALQPTTALEPDIGSIVLQFSASPNISVPLNCSGLVDLRPGQNILDLPSLRCVFKNDTVVVVSSAALPSNGIFNLDPSNPVVRTSPQGITAGAIVVPVALIRPFPAHLTCGSVTLDGTLSYGFGSYSGKYYWYLTASNDTVVHKNAISTYLSGLSSSTSIASLPVSLFTPGCSYRFELSVKNGIGIYSASRAAVNFVALNDIFVPPLTFDGPSSRQAFVGTDTVLRGIVDSSNCDWTSTKAVFQWNLVSINGAAAASSSVVLGTSPSLLLPASYFSSAAVGSTYIFQLSAHPDPALGLSNSVNSAIQFSVAVNARPLTAVSTSRSSFIDETVFLSVDAMSYRGEAISASWKIYSCPKSFADDWFEPAGSDGDIVLSGFDCVNSTGDPFVFPFTNTSGLSTSVIRGTLEPGNYVVTCTVSTESESTWLNIPFALFAANANLPPQVSIALPSTSSLYATEKVMLSAIVSQTIEGLEALELYTFDWRVRFGDLVIPEDRNGLSVLVIPFNSMIPDQELFVEVDVKSRTNPSGPSGTAIVQVPVGRVPTGGIFTVSPSVGTSSVTLFTFTASKWTSPYWPLHYQFSVLDEDGIENAVSELMDIATVSNVTLLAPENVDTNVTVRVRVMDSLGGISVADYNVLVLSNVVVNVKRDAQMALLDDSLQSLENAVNSSDWRNGYRVLSSQIFNRDLVDTLSTTAVDQLWNIINTLPLTTSLTEANVASILTQLNHVLSVLEFSAPAQLQSFLSMLDTMLVADTSRFGTNSIFSIQSTTYFLNAMSSILKNPILSGNSGAIDPLSLIRDHGSQVLDSFIPGEPQFVQESSGLNVAAAVVLSSTTSQFTASSVETTTPNSNARASFNPSTLPTSSTPNTYVGYTFTFYNGTFPHPLPAGSDFTQVAELRLERVALDSTSLRRQINNRHTKRQNTLSKKRAALEDVIQGTTRTTFNVTSTTIAAGESATCTRWDDSTSTWTSDGCTSTTVGSEVQCDCSQGGPLTLLFATPRNNVGKNGKLAGSAIAAIVIVPVIVLIIVIVGVIVFKKHFDKDSPANSLEMRPVAGAAAAGEPSSAPSTVGSSTAELPRATWSKSQLPTNV